MTALSVVQRFKEQWPSRLLFRLAIRLRSMLGPAGLSAEAMNTTLSEAISSGKPFCAIRLGNTEHRCVNLIMQGKTVPASLAERLYITAGVFPKDESFFRSVYLEETSEALRRSDAVGHVSGSRPTREFRKEFLRSSVYFSDCSFLDPVHLLDHEEPWTSRLDGKRVLVVTSHAQSVRCQWRHKEHVWGKETRTLLPFDLAGVVKSPHPPAVEGRELRTSTGRVLRTWKDSLNFLKDEISSHDYDVLLSGAGAYSPALASHAKTSGKIGITTCGTTQLFFGILGSRWLRPACKKHQSYFNRYWIRPLAADQPAHRHLVEQNEGLCYW